MTFQLQIWRGKEYEPSVENADPEYCRSTAEGMRLKSWRIVKLEKCRPDKPRYTVPRGSRGGNDKQSMIDAYLGWAITHGVQSVAAYADDWRVHSRNAAGLIVRRVPVADFLGDAPAPEEDET